jgi:hypothetical protein
MPICATSFAKVVAHLGRGGWPGVLPSTPGPIQAFVQAGVVGLRVNTTGLRFVRSGASVCQPRGPGAGSGVSVKEVDHGMD